MASHKSTPAAVRNAPMIRREVVSDQSDLNRAERRRAFRTIEVDPKTGKHGKPVIAYRRKGTIPRDAQLPTRNRPYRRPVGSTVAGRSGSVVGRVRSMLAGRRERA